MSDLFGDDPAASMSRYLELVTQAQTEKARLEWQAEYYERLADHADAISAARPGITAAELLHELVLKVRADIENLRSGLTEDRD